jgi:hypothetical protein
VKRVIAGAATLFAAMVSAGCSGYRPSVLHPKLKAPTAADIELTCAQIDLAIDRTDTVRWLILDDGGKLETDDEKAARYLANTVLVPLLWAPASDEGNAVLDAADRRLLKLLQLKRDRRCPARPTILPGVDDLALTAQLEELMSRIDGEEGRQPQLLRARSVLLDGLRVLPAAAAGD